MDYIMLYYREVSYDILLCLPLSAPRHTVIRTLRALGVRGEGVWGLTPLTPLKISV